MYCFSVLQCQSHVTEFSNAALQEECNNELLKAEQQYKMNLTATENELKNERRIAGQYRNDLRRVFCVDPNTGKQEEQCTVCPDGWVKGSGVCYFISKESNSWTVSQDRCAKAGAQLVVIQDRKELQFLYNNLNSGIYWIGLRRVGSEWHWVDGSLLDRNGVSFTPYQNQHCAYVYYGYLYSMECNSRQQWICEREAVHV
ncbi:C-type lectin domain family 2 member L-like [Huso huso]|uniref:C-type lectin domain family 2 member L-like n=1 Tax=Huso huso TaxID=61971 RepID=A0ABR0YXL5_HUSHU